MKMNVAILGAGNIARSMATALRGISDEVTAYAVASRSLEKAEKFRDEWGFEKAYGSYEELAKDDKIDLIYVATPHSEHYANTKLCIAHGRNCLVEKAFCGNLKQTKELIQFAKDKNVLLVEAMWTRFQPSKDVVRSLLAEGAIGKIQAMESDFTISARGVERLEKPALAGGALLDLGIYSITVPAMYLGTEIVGIEVQSDITELGVDATDVITFTYKNGVQAVAKCSFAGGDSNYAKIVGDQGYLTFGPINVPDGVSVYDTEGNLVKRIDTPCLVNGYEYEVLECKRMLAEGKKEAESLPLSETIRLMGWMDSIRNHIGVFYPFEEKEDIALSDQEVWGVSNVYGR